MTVKPIAFPDCAMPDDCGCLKRGYGPEHERCAVPAVRQAIADLGIPLPPGAMQAMGLGRDESEPVRVTNGKRHALFINAPYRTVLEVEIDSLDDMQKLIGGYIEAAYQWENGDVLYVDEEGLLKVQDYFFALPEERPDQPFAGNGVLVGREEEGPQFAGGYTTHPPAITADELKAKIVWLSADEVRARFWSQR